MVTLSIVAVQIVNKVNDLNRLHIKKLCRPDSLTQEELREMESIVVELNRIAAKV